MNGNIFSSPKIEKTLLGLFGIVTIFFIFKIITIARSWSEPNPNEPVNTITLSGVGKVFAVADVANFSFTVDETANTVADAQKLATDKNNKAIDYLKKQGIDEKDIQATGYNVNPKYDYTVRPCPLSSQPTTINEAANSIVTCPLSGPKLVGYEVTESVNVKVRDITKAGTILAGIGSLNVTNISGLSFTIDNDKELKAQARKMAIDDARAQAEKLASDLGVSLGKVTSFSENGASPVFYSAKAMDAVSASGAGSVPQLPAGQNEIDSNVLITYQIK